MLYYLPHILLFILGLVIGSFFNVVISRLPNDESIVSPGSHCPNCQHPVRIYDNIPILSYLILKGKCRDCEHPISLQYPLVEFITGIVLVALFMVDGWSIQFLSHAILVLFLIPVAFIDLKTCLILNVLTVPAFILGLILALVFQIENILNLLIGMAAGGGVLLLFGFLGKILFKKDSMGMGDVKLMMVIGIFTGFPGVLLSLLFGVYLAAIVILIGLVLKKMKLGDTIPFGPFLALGTVVYLLWGNTIVQGYLKMVVT